MKPSTLLLSGSLVLNLALLGLIVAGTAASSPRPSAAPPAGVPVSASPAPAIPAEAWADLGKADFAAQRDRLRAEGFPPAVIRALLSAEIREKYAAQRKALEPAADLPYWKNSLPDPKTLAAFRALGRAERQELADLLGREPDDPRAQRYKAQIPGLNDDVAATLAEIQDRYNEQRQDLYSNRGFVGMGSMTPADQEKLRALEKAMHAEFAAVLTPQQLEDYDLRASQTAFQLQYRLAAFDATEAEYRALYQLHAAFDEQYPPGPLSPEQSRARSEATRQLEKQIETTLGADRYAAYQRATDYNYQQTSRLVTRLELPPETADTLYALQTEYRQKQQDLYAAMRNTTAGLGPKERREQIAAQQTALQQDALAKVTAALGGNAGAVEAYKTYGGQWLKSFGAPSATISTGATFIRTGP